jgi:CheY-like chemotaxis protein
VRGIISAVLKRHGYQVLEAVTPRAALDLFKGESGEIDLLLSDVVMPE